MRSRPPILTERGFDRRLAAMVIVAFAVHVVVVLALFFAGMLHLRPDTPIDSYTVEVVDGGELGGHMPAGLPNVNIGPAAAKTARVAPPPVARVEPERPPAPQPPPPEVAKPEPPPPPAKVEAVPPEPPKPEPQQLAREERPDVVIPEKTVATPAPTRTEPPPATPRPTVNEATPAPVRTPRPAPTERPAPSRVPATPRPAPSVAATPAPRARPTPAPSAKPDVALARRDESRPAARVTPAPQRAPAATPFSRDDQIAKALARVQQRVGADRGDTTREQGSAVASARGPTGGGVGGTDAPDASRRVGIGPGAGGAGKVRGVEFLLYYNQMLSRIRGAWVWTGGGKELEVKVRFRILEDGRIADLRVTQTSNDSSYDASVVRAIRAVSPLEPPPAQYRDDFGDVELTFHPADLQTAG